MNKENFSKRIKVDLTDTKDEAKTLRKISKLDSEFQSITSFKMKRKNDLIVHIRENIYGNRKVVQAQFKTLGCRMKKSGSCWNCNYGVMDSCIITPKEYLRSFKQELKSINGNVLVLESLGSITDPKEFDSKLFKEVLKSSINCNQFETILIETHVTQITEDLANYVCTINNGKKNIGFEIGIEDMNPENRKLINKIGVKNNKITEVYNMLEKYGLNLSINLIYGFPFMNEKERINSVFNSVKNISTFYPNADIVLFLMSVKENTILEYIKNKGLYKPANPWGLVELTKQILLDPNIKSLITFSWFGEKEDPYIQETTCYTCPTCKKQIINFFKSVNGTFDSKERMDLLDNLLKYAKSSTCNCYENFKYELDNDDNKNPRLRYKEFLEKIDRVIEEEQI